MHRPTWLTAIAGCLLSSPALGAAPVPAPAPAEGATEREAREVFDPEVLEQAPWRASPRGLPDEQVRFFLDGVPLELAGFPYGSRSLPVYLVHRVALHVGSAPLSFGTSSRGFALNLVTQADPGAHAGASYERASFGTDRATVGAQHLDPASGVYTALSGFYEDSRNDYPIDVQVVDNAGRVQAARVDHYNGGTRAFSGTAEVGIADRPWAKRLTLRGFLATGDHDYAHNLGMTIPYGEVTGGETITGGLVRYEHDWGREVSVDALAGYRQVRSHFLDVAGCVYDWFGDCVRERRILGEVDGRPHDRRYRDHESFGHLNVAWRVHPRHVVRLTIAPSYLTRTGNELRRTDAAAPDPLEGQHELLSVLSGLEYAADLFGERLKSSLFVRHYLQRLRVEEPRALSGPALHERSTQRFGAGPAISYRVFDWFFTRAAYEWTTELPGSSQTFGDGAFVAPNFELEPQASRELNLGLAVDSGETGAGSFRLDAHWFHRDIDDLITLLGGDAGKRFVNVSSARSTGVEGAARWSSPRDYVTLVGQLDYDELINSSESGVYADFEGDRIPQRPNFVADASVRVQLEDVFGVRDQVSASWTTSYVAESFYGWPSVGLPEFKRVTPSHTVHTVGVGYFLRVEPLKLGTTAWFENVTDEPRFDPFGAALPGRSLHVKVSAQL